MGLWLLVTSTVTPSTVVEGFGASAVAALLVAISESVEPSRFRPAPGLIAWFPRAARNAVRDTFVVAKELWRVAVLRRRPRGRLIEVEVKPPRSGATEQAWEFAATVAVSLSPNQYLIGIDRERGRALAHVLVPRGSQSLDDLLS